jgi:hypothetical protein
LRGCVLLCVESASFISEPEVHLIRNCGESMIHSTG